MKRTITSRSKDNKAPFASVYRTLFDRYKTAIITQRYRPGERIDSINEMQTRHGVSRETAKLVLSLLVKDGLILQRPGKGSFVADLGPRIPVWGLVLPFYSAHMQNLLDLMRVEARKAERGVEHFASYNSWEEEVRLVGAMVGRRHEAVIVVPTFDEARTAGFYRRLSAGGTVVALMDHTLAGSYFTYAIQNYDLGVQLAARYLLQRTPDALVFVKNEAWIGRNMVEEMMEDTFRRVVAQSEGRTGLVVENLRDLHADFLRHHRVGGILCSDDLDAVRVIGRLRSEGVTVPRDVALVSYGNTELARFFTPAITSVDSHSEEIAATTARVIALRLQGQDVSRCQYVIQPELVVRET